MTLTGVVEGQSLASASLTECTSFIGTTSRLYRPIECAQCVVEPRPCTSADRHRNSSATLWSGTGARARTPQRLPHRRPSDGDHHGVGLGSPAVIDALLPDDVITLRVEGDGRRGVVLFGAGEFQAPPA
jgi:hypothetical protein